MELQEKRREQDAKIELKRQEKEKAREEAARERERKLEARNAAIESSAKELTKKIQLKVSWLQRTCTCMFHASDKKLIVDRISWPGLCTVMFEWSPLLQPSLRFSNVCQSSVGLSSTDMRNPKIKGKPSYCLLRQT